MPAMLYVLRSSGRSVKGAMRMMPAKSEKVWGDGFGVGCTRSLGRKEESGSAK